MIGWRNDVDFVGLDIRGMLSVLRLIVSNAMALDIKAQTVEPRSSLLALNVMSLVISLQDAFTNFLEL